MTGRSGRIQSAVVIARALDAEGFNEETANLVRRYSIRRSGFSKEQKRRWRARLRDFHEITVKLSAGEKLVLGKFIAMRQKAAFDTGLRIGLTAMACERNKVYGNEEWMLGEE
jgi:hypothetical protein